MAKHPIFKPFPLLVSCHLQTFVGAFFNFFEDPPSITRFVHLADGEKIAINVTTPPNWKEEELTVVLVHGLCGSGKSSYMVRLANKLHKKGVRSIRINLRGCGSGKGLARKLYHSDASNDIYEVIREIKQNTPSSPCVLIGFSLGGNIVLKFAGERNQEAKNLMEKVIAINPPIDLYTSAILLNKNKVYENYFLMYLKEEIAFVESRLEIISGYDPSLKKSLLEFDETYFAPRSGFSTAKEYYYACSSGRLLMDIILSCHILFAQDDPIISTHVVENILLPKNIEIHISKQGGHLGYLGIPGTKGGFYWMDSLIFHWIFDREAPNSSQVS